MPETSEPDPLDTTIREHADWVYACARRRVGDDALASDVTQAVFILFWRKRIATSKDANLTRWLYQAVRYCSANALRLRRIRGRHEKEAAVRSMQNQPTTQPAWNDLAPELEGAVDRLREAYRAAILLRFYRQMPLAEVARHLGISEAAAQKRVERALDQLRAILGKKGLSVSSAALGTVLTDQITTPAPAVVIEQCLASAPALAAGVPQTIATGASRMVTLARTKLAAAILVPLLIGSAWIIAAARPSTTSPVQARSPTTAPAGDTAVELPPATFALRGVVLDPSGRPVEGARVWLPPTPYYLGRNQLRETRTDAQGQYTLPGIPMPPPGWGMGAAVIDVPGYALAWNEVTRKLTFTDDLPKECRLSPAKTIEGVVVDDGGKPIASALVMPYFQSWAPLRYGYLPCGPDSPYTARTDADGRFVVDRVPDGCRAHLTVVADGYAAWRSLDGATSDFYPYVAGADRVRVTLYHGGQCTVRLQRQAGPPVPFPKIVASKDDQRPIRSDVTGDDTVVFSGLAPGTYTIRAEGREWLPIEKVKIEPGSKLTLTMTAAEDAPGKVRSIRGRVVDVASGRPLKQGIYVTEQGARAWGNEDCQTNRNGDFAMLLPPGEYDLSTMGWVEGRYQEQRCKLTVPADRDPETIDWKVPGRARVRGVLLDEQGMPVAGTVDFWWPEYVGPDGRFQVDEPNTSHGPQTCFAVDSTKALGTTFLYDRQHRLDEYRLVLRPLATVKGRVVDADGNPIALDEERHLYLSMGTTTRSARTFRLQINGGDFTISRIALGPPMRLRIAIGGDAPEADLADLKPGEVRDLGVITFAPPAAKKGASLKLGGRLVGADGKSVAGMRVHAIPASGAERNSNETLTDQDGRFTFSGLAPDTKLDLFCSSEVFGSAFLREVPAGKVDVLWQVKPIAADLIGRPAPPLQVAQSLKGDLPDLPDLRGQVVLINVGSRVSRDAGLQEAMSEFNQVAKAYAGKGVSAVMVIRPLPQQSRNGELDAIDTAAYAEDAGWVFAVAEDRKAERPKIPTNAHLFTGQTEAAYDCRRPCVTYVIDKHGTLRGIALVNDLNRWVRDLLAEP